MIAVSTSLFFYSGKKEASNMRAMILAAGLGTRLRPLTNVRPKVLVPVMGVTILEYWVKQLCDADIEAVVINSFHLHEELTSAVRKGNWPVPLHVVREPVLLGTGGGLRNALDFLGDEPFIAVNGDIVCKIHLEQLYRQHLHSGESVSLLLHDCPPFNNVAVDPHSRILGFGKEAFAIAERFPATSLLAFTGIHFIHPEVLRSLQPGTPAEIIPLYNELIRGGRPPKAMFVENLFWREMGSLAAYRNLTRELTRLPAGFLPPMVTGYADWIHPGATVATGAIIKGSCAVGEGSIVGDRAVVEDSILWNDVQIRPDAVVRNCIVTDGARVQGFHEGEIITGLSE